MRTKQKSKPLVIGRVALVASALILFCILFSSAAAAASPKITSISPCHGPLAGQNQVFIRGNNFVDISLIFGQYKAHSYTYDDKTIDVFVPAATVAGPVDVKVTNSDGTSNTITYTYDQSGSSLGKCTGRSEKNQGCGN